MAPASDVFKSGRSDGQTEVIVVKKAMLVVFTVLALAGCKDRVIWNDNGKMEEATKDREVWDSNGQMETGERKIWVNKDGEEVVR